MSSLNSYNTNGISETFNQIQWTNKTIKQFEAAVRNAKNYQACFRDVSLKVYTLPFKSLS